MKNKDGLLNLYLELGEQLNEYKGLYPENFPAFATPIISFGNLTKARIVTVGINPSHLEFCDKNGQELAHSERRFVHSNNGQYDLNQVESQFDYFNVNPYRRWFNPVNDLLGAFGASYFDKDGGLAPAAHTDIRSPFPTKPAWGKLPKHIQSELSNDSGLKWWFRIMDHAREARLIFLFCKCDLMTKSLVSRELLSYDKGQSSFTFYESKLKLHGREVVLIHTTDYRGVTPGNLKEDKRALIRNVLSGYREIVQMS